MKPIINTAPIIGMPVVVEGVVGMFPGKIVSSEPITRSIRVKVSVPYYDLPAGSEIVRSANWVHPRPNWNQRKQTVIPARWLFESKEPACSLP